MSVKKRAFVTALLLCMVAAVVWGCSSGKGSPGNNAGPADTAAAGTADKPASDDTPKKVEKVYVYANLGNLGVTSDVSKPEAIEEVRKAIIDKAGIEVIPIIPPKGSEDDKLNILLASNEKLDIFKGSMSVHQANGAVMPLNDLLDAYGADSRKLWPADWTGGWEALSTSDGKIWGVPEVPPMAGTVVLLREDWMKKLNLQMPTTMDELENVLKTFKEQDPAGNGQTIPLLTSLVDLNLSLAAGFMDVGYGMWVDSNGKVQPPVFHPGYKEFIGKMADWYKKGYIYKESFSTQWDQWIEMIKQNRVAGTALWHSAALGNQSALQENVPEAKYVVADQLQGPMGNVITMNGNFTNGYMISKNAQNPEGAMKYINWLQSDIENYMLAFFGIEGKHWRWVDKENKVYEKLNKDYVGELITAGSFAYTVQFRDVAPAGAPAFEFYRDYLTNPKYSKKIGLFDVLHKFDDKVIKEKIPMLADIDRMIEEQTVKFIMGARPMSEYDSFLEELKKVGIDQWVEGYTEEYNKAKSAK